MIGMIFAAGLGTRLKPITNEIPKALVEVDGKPLLKIQLDRFYELGMSDVVVNVHHFSDKVVNYLAENPYKNMNVVISDESSHLLNTGGGMKKALNILKEKMIQEPLLIHNVDILDNARLEDMYCHFLDGIDVLLLVSNRDTKRYLLFDENNKMVGWTNVETNEIKSPYKDIEIRNCKKLAFGGVHVVGEKVRQAMETWPDEFSIIDFYIEQCQNLNIQGYLQDDLRLLDVGKPDTLSKASLFLKSM